MSQSIEEKYDLDKLEDEELKQQYAVETHNRFTVLLSIRGAIHYREVLVRLCMS